MKREGPASPRSLMQPLISIVISTYNRCDFLVRALDSVLSQTYSNIEVIIIDDGSNDGTQQAIDQYLHDHRILLIQHEHNRGLPSSLNEGISKAKGQYIARIDDDDYWHDTTKLEKQLEYMERHGSCGILGTAYINEEGVVASNPQTDLRIRKQLLFRCPICHSSAFIRASIFRKIGGYDESLPYAEDWDMWLRIGINHELHNLPDVALTRSRGDKTLSERYFVQQIRIARGFAKQYGRYYPGMRLALVYHFAVEKFFTVVRVDGKLHNLARSLFKKVFSTSLDFK